MRAETITRYTLCEAKVKPRKINRTRTEQLGDFSGLQGVVWNVCRICLGHLLGCHVHGLEIMTLAPPPLSLLTLPGYCRFTWFPAGVVGCF